MDAHWAREAQDRLAAYLRGEIQTISLADVIAKNLVNAKTAILPIGVRGMI